MLPEPTENTAARINARKLAEDVFAYAISEAEAIPSDFRKMVWSLLAYRIAEHTGTINDCPRQQNVNPKRPEMPLNRCRAFEKAALPFKTSHGTKRVGDIPLSFLHWLLDKHKQESRWFSELEGYLNSKLVAQEEREAEEFEHAEND